MVEKGYKQINLPSEIVDRIRNQTRFKSDADIDSFHKWMIATIERFVSITQFLTKYAPGLEIYGIGKDGIIIKDRGGKDKGSQLSEIQFIDKKLFCSVCKHDCCMHIVYAVGSPEFGNLAKKIISRV